MSWQLASLLLLGGSTVLLFIGLPVAFSFMAINILGAAIFLGGAAGLDQMVRNSAAAVINFSLTPIPLFVLMGEVLFHTGLALKVIDGIERLVRQVPGRLAVVAVVAGTVFSPKSGSTIATTAMLGSLMLPVMLSRGYHPTMATGPLMAIGAVDMLIPPSALTVLLGSLSGISISKLLIGGIVPGLILSAAFVVYIVLRVKMNPSLAPAASFTEYRGWEKFRPLVQYVVPLVSIFVVVVASMSAGWATPTESAAIGALFTILLAAAYRAISVDNLLKALRGTAGISGMILFIIVGAMTFSQILSFSGASNGMVEIIATLGLPPLALIAVMMLVLIFLGLFVEQVSMMMITLPIFMPLVQKLGIDPVWFGVMFLICMQLGLLLPPHWLLLMTMKGVSPPQVTMGHIFHGEGILAVTKALLQSGISYVGGYQGAPVSHVMDVLNDARDIMDELGIHVETNASEAGAAAMLGASINYPLRGAVAWKSTVGTNVASDALSNLSSAGVRGGALIVIGEDYGEGASIIQERSHAFAMKSQIWLLDPRPNLRKIVEMVEQGFELS